MAKSTNLFRQHLHLHDKIITFRAFLSFLFIVLLSATAFGQGGKQPPPPPSPGRGGTVAGFEVDADYKPNYLPPFWFTLTNYDPDYIPPAYYPNTSTLGADWRSILTYNSSNHTFTPIPPTNKRATGKVDGNWGNQSQVLEAVSFAGSSNKNGDQIGSTQSPYSLQLGGTGPQKNDITNTFLHSREDGNGDTWLFFAAETRATNGASYLDFEYNQAGAYVDTPTLRLIGRGPNGGRTPGDFIIVVDYVGGGTTPVVGVRVWEATGTTTGQWSDTIPAATFGAFIAANVLNVAALDSVNKSSYTDAGAPSAIAKALQMVEGGINISDLDDVANLNLCSPNATVTVKTRSSPSFTSELKDLDVLLFSIIPGPGGTNTSQSQCADTIGGTWATFDLTLDTAYVSGTDGFVVGWFKDSAFTPTEVISNPKTYKAPNGTVVYAKLENSEGCVGRAADTLLVKSTPPGTHTSQTQCADTIGGTWKSFDLTLDTAAVSPGSVVVGWYTSYTPNVPVGSAFSGLIATPDAFKAQNNTVVFAKLQGTNGCYGFAKDTLYVNSSPTGTNTSQALCSDTIGGTWATFDLTRDTAYVSPGSVVVGWYRTYTANVPVGSAFTNAIADPKVFKAQNNTVVYAKLQGTNGCFGFAKDTLYVNTTPPGTNTSQTQCTDTIGGNWATFNLTEKNTVVTGNVVGVSVRGWFKNYNTSSGVFTDSIATPGAYKAQNGAVVYAKITNASSCFGVAADTLKVNQSPTGVHTQQSSCPDTVHGTWATFDLTARNGTVVGSTGATVSGWYRTFTPNVPVANAFSNPISPANVFKAQNNTIVYAKLQGTNGCYGFAADTLKVFTSPGNPAVDYHAPACDSSTFNITVSGVQQGVKYYILDRNRLPINGVKVNFSTNLTSGYYQAPSTSNFKFTNIPAGSGYRVWAVSSDGCLSDTTVCGSPSTTITRALVPTQEEPVVQSGKENSKIMDVTDVKAIIGAPTRVSAVPNPFTDRVRFNLQSAVSGQGSLEIYNIAGQKIATVYQGYVEAGKPVIKEYVVPRAQRANLVYIFRVGDQKATGKLLNR